MFLDTLESRQAAAASVVVTGLLSLFLLRKHFITEKILKKKSGDVNDEANFSLFILLHKRAKPILPPYPFPPPPRANSNPLPPPLPSPSAHPWSQDLSKKFHYNTQRCNYKTNSSESIKRQDVLLRVSQYTADRERRRPRY